MGFSVCTGGASGLSTFDPFGMVGGGGSGGSIGDDIFKTDPFSNPGPTTAATSSMPTGESHVLECRNDVRN